MADEKQETEQEVYERTAREGGYYDLTGTDAGYRPDLDTHPETGKAMAAPVLDPQTELHLRGGGVINGGNATPVSNTTVATGDANSPVTTSVPSTTSIRPSTTSQE